MNKLLSSILLSCVLVAVSCSKTNQTKHVDSGREGFLNLYAINDYHGRISENPRQKELGISKLSNFLNEQKYDHELEYVFLNSGDLWQDTFESNINKGKCLTEVMDAMGCEAMELGNHEFDWGLETIKENKNFASKCSYLGANIYYYDNEKRCITTHADDLCDPYKIVERNGYRIGIIGIIGKSQITSITSTVWENIAFIDPLDVVKEYSLELRQEHNCDLIVLLSHADTSSLSLNFCESITKTNDDTNKPYIDCCFTAHSHALENKTYNNVPFIQGEFKGEFVSHLEFDMRGEKPACLTAENLLVDTEKSDPEIDKIVNRYINKEFILKRDEVVCKFTNTSSINTTNAGKLQAYATYQAVKHLEEEQNINIVATINNGGRDTVRLPDSGEVTREMLFNISPFTNKTIVAKVNGANLKNALRNNKYYAPKKLQIESSETYYIACIDYVLLHKTSERKYDNFSLYDGNVLAIEERFPDELIYNEFRGKTIDKGFFNDPGFSNLI